MLERSFVREIIDNPDLPDELISKVHSNVGRYCRRFVILDLVRHWLPLTLFRLAVSPLIHPVNAADGRRSIQRSYTPREMAAMVARALEGTTARYRHSVAPFYMRQIVDI